MKKRRLIPVVLLRNGWLVQSIQFSRYLNLGNPVWTVRRLSEWASDELIYLDITSDDQYDLRREDLGAPNRRTFLEIIGDVSKVTFMPMTVGGKIRTLDDIQVRLSLGADKISINTMAFDDPTFIGRAAAQFGSQCIVVSIDYKEVGGAPRVMVQGGRRDTGLDPVAWARTVEERGAGEILLNSIDRDGMKSGYDIDTIARVCEAVRIPVIAQGGVGRWEHFEEALSRTSVDAVAAANIFQHTDQSVYYAKQHLMEAHHNVREPGLISL
ncbi:MAG TPA: imidazole glycerol phosphate synthase cyclase subunit [Steroidobacteraceae bacterium]|nr:imidazole glycerol phosphate synthase cyclase subunit [Steroidobacteraceae bacterium]